MYLWEEMPAGSGGLGNGHLNGKKGEFGYVFFTENVFYMMDTGCQLVTIEILQIRSSVW